jgi:multiple sugar transport system substrate-binding protein
VSNPNKGLDGYAYRGSWGNPIVTEFNAWNWSYGGDIFDEEWQVIVNQPTSVAALTDFIAFTREVSSKQGNYNSTREVANAMLDGSAVSAIVWPTENSLLQTAVNPAIASQIRIIPFPAEQRQTSQLGNWLLGVPVTAPHKQIAFDFILWATSRQTMIDLAYLGLPPTRHSVFQDPTLVEQFWWFPATEEALQHATWRPRTPEWNKIEHILGNYLARALSDELTPQEALDQAAQDIQKLMAQAGY